MPTKIRENEVIADERNIKTNLAVKPSKGINRYFKTK
jgi:hypothetical protein